MKGIKRMKNKEGLPAVVERCATGLDCRPTLISAANLGWVIDHPGHAQLYGMELAGAVPVDLLPAIPA
jgi:hypothetical protein